MMWSQIDYLMQKENMNSVPSGDPVLLKELPYSSEDNLVCSEEKKKKKANIYVKIGTF